MKHQVFLTLTCLVIVCLDLAWKDHRNRQGAKGRLLLPCCRL